MSEAEQNLDKAAREFEQWVREQLYGSSEARPKPAPKNDEHEQQPPSSTRE